MSKKLYLEFILLTLMGMATSLSLPPFNFFLINFLTFSYLFIFLVKKSQSQFNKLLYFFYGWFFGFGFFVTNLYWVSILRLTRGVFEVMATGGDSALGGDDYDHALADAALASMGLSEVQAGLSAEDKTRLKAAARALWPFLCKYLYLQ